MIAPPIIGWIHSTTLERGEEGYAYVEVFFIGVSILAFSFNVGVYFFDRKNRENILQSVMPLEEFEKYT